MPEATSASITPDCRAGRGNDGAWDEAVRRLRVEYDAVIEGWRDQPVQPTIRVALIVERPAGHGVECLNGVFTPGYAKDSGWRPGRDDPR